MPWKRTNLSHRFIATLMSAVIVIVGICAAIAIYTNKTRMEAQLAQLSSQYCHSGSQRAGNPTMGYC